MRTIINCQFATDLGASQVVACNREEARKKFGQRPHIDNCLKCPWRVAAGASLGDFVAGIAKPIARAIDVAFGTDLEHCQPCGARQDEWNKRRLAV